MVAFLSLLLVLVLAPLSHCSSGDRSVEFFNCVRSCKSSVCTEGGELSVILRVLQWTCEEDCQYHCMHNITADDLTKQRPVRQFYGKWPFIRVLGVQEPASTLFSVLNGLSMIVAYYKFHCSSPSSYPYHTALLLQLTMGLNAWFWSTVFHSRDTYWTEKLDYFSAAAYIVAGLLVQFIRLTGPHRWKWHFCYSALWAVLYCCHVTYLTGYKFDYGYNMAASVLAGVLYTVVWMVWCLKVLSQRRYVWKCMACVLATSCFLGLELLDFPPLLWIFDAHSLWHLSTVPLPFIWYSFLIDDALFEADMLLAKQV